MPTNLPPQPHVQPTTVAAVAAGDSVPGPSLTNGVAEFMKGDHAVLVGVEILQQFFHVAPGQIKIQFFQTILKISS